MFEQHGPCGLCHRAVTIASSEWHGHGQTKAVHFQGQGQGQGKTKRIRVHWGAAVLCGCADATLAGGTLSSRAVDGTVWLVGGRAASQCGWWAFAHLAGAGAGLHASGTVRGELRGKRERQSAAQCGAAQCAAGSACGMGERNSVAAAGGRHSVAAGGTRTVSRRAAQCRGGQHSVAAAGGRRSVAAGGGCSACGAGGHEVEAMVAA